MIFMITLTISALLILIAGLMEIRMPFISHNLDENPEKQDPVKKLPGIKENLVKDSVENTTRTTRFLNHKINENIF